MGGSPPSPALARAQPGGHAGGGSGSPLGGGEGRQSGLPQGATRGGGRPGLLAAQACEGRRRLRERQAGEGARQREGTGGGVFRFSSARPARQARRN